VGAAAAVVMDGIARLLPCAEQLSLCC